MPKIGGKVMESDAVKRISVLESCGVFAFYLFILVTGVVLLAGAQLRSSSGAAFDTWRLNYESNRELVDRLTSQLARQRAALRDVQEQGDWAAQCTGLFDDDGKLKPGLEDAVTEARTAKQTHTESQLDGDAKCINRGRTLIMFDLQSTKARTEDLTQQIKDTEASIASQNNQYSDLIKGHEDYLALEAMMNGALTRPIVSIPYDLLVLLLVLMTGALGGMVRILRDYGSETVKNPAPQDYFLIPLIGAVVAVGGYVLAKTGLLLLSSSKEEASLSPFMISLVGIVSGLLAKEVIDTIATRGREMLNQQQRDQDGGDQGGNQQGKGGRTDEANL